ncbi:MAG: TonB-dependent receptor [Sphingomonadaceae bacterium]
MKNPRTLYLVASLLAGSGLAGMPTVAMAQEADGADSADQGGGLGEIIVTAQKREQNLQDVPLAISAIGSEKIENLGVSDSRDISGMTPNVTIVQGTTSNTGAAISMRGISNGGSESFGLDMASGVYVDGVYIGRSGAAGLDVMDLERVEVLRGPQGTLFGRNTTGGAIHFISRDPSETFRLKAEAGYGNFNAWNGRIVVDPGEIAGISTSFSYSHRQRDGVVDNLNETRDSRDPGARKSDSFRGSLKFDLGGTGSFRYIFDWSKIKGATSAFQLTNTADGTPRQFFLDGEQLVVTQQAPVSQYLGSAAFADPQCAALAVPTRQYRDQVCNDISNYTVDKIWGHNVQVQNDFGPFAVKMTTGYRFWNSDNIGSDIDGIGAFTGPAFTSATLFNGMPEALLQYIPSIPAAARSFIAASPVPTVQQNLFDTSNKRRHKQFSQEIEVSGDTDHLDWVVGGFYFWEKGSEDGWQNSGFVYDTNAIFTGQFGALGPAFVAANPARYRLVQTLSRLAYTTQAESTAIYGQATFYPGGRDSGLRLTAGGRYTWDNKQITRIQNGSAPFAEQQRGKASFSKFTWNLMLGYDIADGITTYARAATGYRSGGYNSGDSFDSVANEIPSFGAESVTSYEIGFKSELFNRRVRFNLAGYYNIYDDLAVNVPLTNAPLGTFATRVANAGKVNYMGFEAELQAVLTNNFTFEGNIGYVDIKYKEFLGGRSLATGEAVDIASVVTPGYTSPLTANAALNAHFPISWGDARIIGRVGYTHEDGKYSFSTEISSPFNEAIKGDDRDLIDAHIGIDRIPLGSAEGKILLWGKNLTNSHDFVRGIDFGALGYAGGYFADPRAYGVTVGIQY